MSGTLSIKRADAVTGAAQTPTSPARQRGAWERGRGSGRLEVREDDVSVLQAVVRYTEQRKREIKDGTDVVVTDAVMLAYLQRRVESDSLLRRWLSAWRQAGAAWAEIHKGLSSEMTGEPLQKMNEALNIHANLMQVEAGVTPWANYLWQNTSQLGLFGVLSILASRVPVDKHKIPLSASTGLEGNLSAVFGKEEAAQMMKRFAVVSKSPEFKDLVDALTPASQHAKLRALIQAGMDRYAASSASAPTLGAVAGPAAGFETDDGALVSFEVMLDSKLSAPRWKHGMDMDREGVYLFPVVTQGSDDWTDGFLIEGPTAWAQDVLQQLFGLDAKTAGEAQAILEKHHILEMEDTAVEVTQIVRSTRRELQNALGSFTTALDDVLGSVASSHPGAVTFAGLNQRAVEATASLSADIDALRKGHARNLTAKQRVVAARRAEVHQDFLDFEEQVMKIRRSQVTDVNDALFMMLWKVLKTEIMTNLDTLDSQIQAGVVDINRLTGTVSSTAGAMTGAVQATVHTSLFGHLREKSAHRRSGTGRGLPTSGSVTVVPEAARDDTVLVITDRPTGVTLAGLATEVEVLSQQVLAVLRDEPALLRADLDAVTTKVSHADTGSLFKAHAGPRVIGNVFDELKKFNTDFTHDIDPEAKVFKALVSAEAAFQAGMNKVLADHHKRMAAAEPAVEFLTKASQATSRGPDANLTRATVQAHDRCVGALFSFIKAYSKQVVENTRNLFAEPLAQTMTYWNWVTTIAKPLLKAEHMARLSGTTEMHADVVAWMMHSLSKRSKVWAGEDAAAVVHVEEVQSVLAHILRVARSSPEITALPAAGGGGQETVRSVTESAYSKYIFTQTP